jgi:SAM-dependent methyltransferase
MEIIIKQDSVRKKVYGDYNPYEGFDALPVDEQGWSSTSPVFEEVIAELKPKLIVEVGSWKGCSAIFMAQTCLKYYDNFEIVCIDTFLGSVEHWTGDQSLLFKGIKNGRPAIYEQFLSNVIYYELEKYITPLPVDSVNGHEILKHHQVQADLIYIDAGHDYISVRVDLNNYTQDLRQGGYLLGDDWFHEPIKDAVYDTFERKDVIEKSRDKFLWIK